MKNTMRISHSHFCIFALAALLFLGFSTNNSYGQKKAKVVYDETFEEVNGMKRVRLGEFYGFLNSKGKVIVEPIYYEAKDFDENGLARVKNAAFFGLINKEGIVVVHLGCNLLKYYPEWKRYLGIQTFTGHCLYDETGKEIDLGYRIECSNITPDGIGICKNLENENYGIFSVKTGLLTKIEYQKIYSAEKGYRTYEYKNNGVLECGFFDVNGNKMNEIYEDAFDFTPDGIATVKRNGLFGFLDTTGKMITDFEFEKVSGFKQGSSIVLKKGIPGTVNIKGEYQATNNVVWDEDGKVVDGYRWVKYLGLYGFTDNNNVIVIPVLYNFCYGFRNGIAGVEKNGKYGFVNAQHKEIIPIKYDYAGKVNEGMILVKEGDLYGYYNDKGVLVSKIEFEKAEDFSGGFANITIGEKAGKIDKLGKITWEKETIYTLVDDKSEWAEEEKLKNIVDAKSVAKLPAGSAYGLQISKNVVSNRRVGYFLSSIGYKNGNYFGTAYSGGGNSGILFNQDVDNQDKAGLITKSSVTFINIKEDKSGKFIGIGDEKIQEIEVLESSVSFGKYVQVDLDLMEVCVSTNDIVAVLAKGEIDAGDPYYSPNDLYLILWDRKNKLVSTFLIHDGIIALHPKIAATSDGNFVIGFDARPTSSLYRTTFEKIDVNTSLQSNKLKSLWKRTYSSADKYQLTDMIIDSQGNVVSAYKSSELEGVFTDDSKTKFKYAEIGIVKFNSKGDEFRSYVIKSMSPELWGRSSDGGKLDMRNQEIIYFSSNENPKIIENPKGPGYIICSRLSYGLWVWSAEYQTMSDKYKSMYADQPAFAIIDENSLDVTSFDFIETTGGSNGHNFEEYKITKQLGQSWDINDFYYNSEANEYVITENYVGDYYNTHIWTFAIKLLSDWSGEAGGTEVVSTTSANSTSTTGTKTNSTSTSGSTTNEKEFTGNVYFKYDMMGSNSAAERLYIHYGSNAAYKTSTTKGSAATVKCQKGKVYYSFTGEKSDMKEFMEMSVDDCGKTFKYTEFK